MPEIAITTVRYTGDSGRKLLRSFIFGDTQTGSRVPRGIEPKLVSQFIREEVLLSSSPEALRRTAAVLRFYERGDVVEHLARALTGQEKVREDLLRSVYVVQCVGEVGTRAESDQAAQYFDSRLVPHREAVRCLPQMIDALVILAPSGSPECLTLRIGDEVRLRQPEQRRSEEGMRAYQQIAAVQRNQLPTANRLIQAKVKLLAAKPPERRAELIQIYLGKSSLSTDWMMTWAGRILRRDAMEQDPGAIHAGLAKEMDSVDRTKVGTDAQVDTIVCRAAQAILYLKGELTRAQRELNDKVQRAAMNFLWDDLPMEG